MVNKFSKALIGLSAALAFSYSAQASFTPTPVDDYQLVWADVPSNQDCTSYYEPDAPVDGDVGIGGSSFDNCSIFEYENGTRIEISPVIRKFEVSNSGSFDSEDGEDEGSTYQGETSASDWGFDGTNEFSTGSWTYDSDSGVNIRYWTAKAGNQFRLFWYVSDDDYASCDPEAFNLACLTAAIVTNTGTWTTPSNGNGGGAGLSHITFFNSMDPVVVVPEPTTLAVFALGLIGLACTRRRV